MLRFPLQQQDVVKLVRASLPHIGTPPTIAWLSDGVSVTYEDRAKVASLLDGVVAPAVIAIGAFDGVHVGHQAIVGGAAEDARRRGVPCVVVTFDPDPADVLAGPERGTRILATRERACALVSAGADAVLTCPFTPSLARLTYRRFLADYLGRLVRIVSIHVGIDFRLGHAGAGTVDALASYGATHGFAVEGHPLVMCDGEPVTATRIRGLIFEGNVDAAHGLLGRLPVVSGLVERGRGEGTGFGFPTANVRCPAPTCMPGTGVYAAIAVLEGDGPSASDVVAYGAAVNVGAPPTFSADDDPFFLEAHLVGFKGDLYGRVVSMAFCDKIRGARRFESREELKKTVKQNIFWVKNNLGSGIIPIDSTSV